MKAHQQGYGNNAMGVGGGTRVWGAQAWRFSPDDFRMASRYGVPEGSSLADWPIGYADLAPHYEWAEYALGVAGQEGHLYHGPRNKPFPMPPGEGNLSKDVLAAGAKKLGWSVHAVPLAINSQEYQGRSACAHAGICVGFACPSNAKGGSQNTMIPAAMKTGLFTLATQMQVTSILAAGRGMVRGVEVVDASGVEKQIAADSIVVSAGAIESARLLMVSEMGNHSDQLGRNLQSHLYTGAHADFDVPLANTAGPGVSISTCQFNHDNEGIVGGGMIANDFPVLPIQFWATHHHQAPASFGLEAKQWMRHAYHHRHTIMGPTQEIPDPESRIRLDPQLKDRYGMPVAQLSGGVHPESIRTGQFMRQRAVEWLEASGGTNIEMFGAESGAYVSAGQHQAGTCRMGDDDQTSVTDSWGRVHHYSNLYVADASLHVTNGGFNPALTVMACASRVAEGIVAEQN
jgi:choline dehydrogenase-like flavoprotein